MKLYFISKIKYLTLIILLSILDQFSKIYIHYNFDKLLNKDFIIFKIDFVRNYGAAFNILSGNRFFLSFISVISTIILSYLIFKKNNNSINKYGLTLILAGSVGNGIDRILNGYVIDFIKIKFINFPVFNIADLLINIGVLILISSYFRYKKTI